MINYPYAVISDIHYHDWDFGSYINTDYINSRLQDSLDATRLVAKTLREKGGKDIIITGDMFHTRGSIKPSVYNPVYELYKELSDQGFVVWAIPGNHDLETEETTVRGTTFASFETIPDFNIFYGQQYVDLGTDEVACFLPWFESGVELEKASSFHEGMFLGGRYKVTLFMHVGLTDVLDGVTGTYSPEYFHANFKGLKNAFSGHFHNHKHFRVNGPSGNSDIYSVGALTHQAFRDVNSKAGFLIVSDKDTVEHFETESPKFVDFDEHDYGLLEKLDPSKFTGNFVRITLNHLAQEDLDAINLCLTAIGALRVVNRSKLIKATASVSSGLTPTYYVFGAPHLSPKTKLSKDIENYINSKYDKILAGEILLKLKDEEFDE